MIKKFENIKVGDIVILNEHLRIIGKYITKTAEVSHVTRYYFIVNGIKFHKKDGKSIHNGVYGYIAYPNEINFKKKSFITYIKKCISNKSDLTFEQAIEIAKAIGVNTDFEIA